MSELKILIDLQKSDTPPTTPTQSIREKGSSKETHVERFLKTSQELKNPDREEKKGKWARGHRRNNSSILPNEKDSINLSKSLSFSELSNSDLESKESKCPITPTYGIR